MVGTVIEVSAVDVPINQLYTHSYFHLLGVAILCYDHLITFGEEYRRIWIHPLTGASLRFLLTRYFALIATITITIGNFSAAFSTIELYSCANYAFYRQVVLMAIQLLVADMQFLRTYALYGKSKKFLAWIFLAGAVLIGLSIWAVNGQTAGVSIQQGCHIASSKTSAIHVAVGWEALFVFDSMIFMLTLYKTYHERVKYSLTKRLDLVSLMFRDGAIYFGVMVFAEGVNVITFYVCAPALRGVLSTAASAISVTMISRLTLNLRNTTSATSTHINATTLPLSNHIFSTLRFTTQISHGNAAEEEEEDEDGEQAYSHELDGNECGTRLENQLSCEQ